MIAHELEEIVLVGWVFFIHVVVDVDLLLVLLLVSSSKSIVDDVVVVVVVFFCCAMKIMKNMNYENIVLVLYKPSTCTLYCSTIAILAVLVHRYWVLSISNTNTQVNKIAIVLRVHYSRYNRYLTT